MNPCQRGNGDGVAYLFPQKNRITVYFAKEKMNFTQTDNRTIIWFWIAVYAALGIQFGERCPFLWGDICEARPTARRATTKIDWKSTELTSAAIIHIFTSAPTTAFPICISIWAPAPAPQLFNVTMRILYTLCEHYVRRTICFHMFFSSVFVFFIDANHNGVDGRRVTCEKYSLGCIQTRDCSRYKIINIQQRTVHRIIIIIM